MSTSEADGRDDNPMSYAQAITEVEQILAELESSEIDVDKLANRVQRASQLLQLCRERLQVVHVDVEKLISGLEGSSGGPTADE